MPDTSPKKAQKEETNSEYIKIRVVDADSIEVQFKAKKTTNMGKLMQSYSDRKNVDLNVLRFLFDDRRIKADDTPKELGLEDGDIIEVFQEQLAGRK
jgi:small ubiquitin-related modifier